MFKNHLKTTLRIAICCCPMVGGTLFLLEYDSLGQAVVTFLTILYLIAGFIYTLED